MLDRIINSTCGRNQQLPNPCNARWVKYDHRVLCDTPDISQM